MPLTNKQIQTIQKGRLAVDAYRSAHTLLHQKPYYRGIHDDHTPLLNTMLGAFKGQGFNSLKEFFDASELFNIQEAKGDVVLLDGMWQ